MFDISRGRSRVSLKLRLSSSLSLSRSHKRSHIIANRQQRGFNLSAKESHLICSNPNRVPLNTAQADSDTRGGGHGSLTLRFARLELPGAGTD